MSKNFAIIGVAGYIAPRHLKAIKITDLHTQSYKHTLAGNGFGIENTLQSIKIALDIRHADTIGLNSRNIRETSI